MNPFRGIFDPGVRFTPGNTLVVTDLRWGDDLMADQLDRAIITRRRFVQTLGVSAIGLALAACAPASAPAGAPAQSPAAGATAPAAVSSSALNGATIRFGALANYKGDAPEKTFPDFEAGGQQRRLGVGAERAAWGVEPGHEEQRQRGRGLGVGQVDYRADRQWRVHPERWSPSSSAAWTPCASSIRFSS
jgi:hypothetical protein